MRRTLMSALPLLLLTAVACENDLNEPPAMQPEYSLSISGALTETAAGPAWFGTDEDDEGNPVWALVLGQDTSRHLVIAGRSGSARPATGTYVLEGLGGSDWSLLHTISDGDELLGLFAADSGTVVITESSASVVRGTLDFDASGLFGEDMGEVAVTGNFVAVPAPGATMARIGTR